MGARMKKPTLIYEDYKEPLKKIEKGEGFGYYGTVALTEDRSLIQCHICGNLFASVGGHLRTHKMTAVDYKEKFGLSATTALVSEPIREMAQKRAVGHLAKKGELPTWLVNYNKGVQSGKIKHPGRKHPAPSLEERNKKGLCPDQVLEKIKDLGDKLHKVPSRDEFSAEYKGRYMNSIKYLHGSWRKAVTKAYGTTREELRRPDSTRLIEDLQEFQKRHKRIPMTSDFNRGLLRDRGVYIRVFGSLNNARIEAGLNAVIPMPFGNIVELTPEQYREYKQGNVIPGKISKTAIYQRKRRAERKRSRSG